MKWVLWVKPLDCEANNIPPSTAEVKNICGSVPLVPHTFSWCGALLIEHRDNFTFTI
jgi:hypothetical protein